MPNQIDGVLLHTMSGTELSHVRTELKRWRIVATIPPHPVQANPQTASQRNFGNTLVPTHCQMYVATSPLRVDACRGLCCLYQQESQQRVALLGDVPQALLAGTGVLTRTIPTYVPICFPQ